MTDETTRQVLVELAELRGEVATLRAELEVARAGQSSLSALGNQALLAPTVFSDLDAAGPEFRSAIQAIAAAGITVGADDPNSIDPNVRVYNPKGFVTREQMAIFLAKTAGLGGFPPVAIAANGDGAVRVARAISAYTLDPQNYLTVTAAYPGPDFQPVVTVSLTAPAPGFVLVTGAVELGAEKGTSSTGTSTAVFARLRDAGTNASSLPLYAGTDRSIAAAISPTFVFPVAAGARSFVLEVQKAGSGNVVAYNGVLTALFVPFGATGTSTLGD
ncbi:MAG: hypothetical protein AVDCRST_MAG88-933 [uncultured Thermomicrobiales bacterium]|uniref:SLH domain-containing protein n=1 Tax=uncultured Thermomicrobiales bacterium TaxID=1645740 RepID=A0A6J4UQ46_9BACT|nr:MAG: hypothetical protein AVDCRST_MAG88-933 [uncultured Thermomicrobiales bacterium]